MVTDLLRRKGWLVSYSVVRRVCQESEYNQLRSSLRRSARLRVPVVPPGYVGLVVQALSVDDCPLKTVYGFADAGADHEEALEALEEELRQSIG